MFGERFEHLGEPAAAMSAAVATDARLQRQANGFSVVIEVVVFRVRTQRLQNTDTGIRNAKQRCTLQRLVSNQDANRRFAMIKRIVRHLTKRSSQRRRSLKREPRRFCRLLESKTVLRPVPAQSGLIAFKYKELNALCC